LGARGARVSKKRLQLSLVTADWRPSRSTLSLETFDPWPLPWRGDRRCVQMTSNSHSGPV